MITLMPSILNESSLLLQVTRTTIKALMCLNFVKIPSPTTELAALEHLKNLVTTLAPLCLIGSSSFLQITRTTIKSRMGSKFCQIRSLAAELAALECREKFP